MEFNQLKPRVVTGVTIAVIFVALVIWAYLGCTGSLILASIGAVGLAVCAWEYSVFSCNAIPRNEVWPRRFIVPLLVFLPVLAPFDVIFSGTCEDRFFDRQNLAQNISIATWCGGAFLVLVGILVGRASREAIERFFSSVIPLYLLVGVCGAYLVGLVAVRGAPGPLLWLVIVICINDIAAYFGGTKFGVSKIAPAVSPGKTWIGSACGLGAGVLVGLVAGAVLRYSSTWSSLFLLSIAVIIAGQVGDLLKSYLKRLHGVKDSSNILPGHGGILDRLDGILAGAPLVFFLWR